MTRSIHKLSLRRVATVKAPGKYGDGGGLWLRVEKDGSKRWVYLWQRDKRTREMGLGSVIDVSLAHARDEADKARRLVSQGLDPIEIRAAEAKVKAEAEEVEAEKIHDDEAQPAASSAPTFRKYSATYIATHEDGWKNAKHRQQWRNSIDTHATPILDKPVDSITVHDIVDLLAPIWRTIPETAGRLRGRIESILDAAKVEKHILSPWENPARWKGNLIYLLPARPKKSKVKHHAAMAYEDLPDFYAKLRKRPARAARALELTVLCATRTNETLRMTWEEIDFKAGTWTIPAERMKMGVEHRIPLSSRALELLDGMLSKPLRAPDRYVFPGFEKGMPLSQMSMTMVLRRMKLGHFTVHGMRSSFRDYMGDMTDYPEAVVEQALAHQVGDETTRAYRRRNAFLKRRALMEDWTTYLLGAMNSDSDAIEAVLQEAA